MAKDPEMEALVTDFAGKLTELVTERTRRSVQAMLAPLLQGQSAGAAPTFSFSGRPRQLCPVPGCEKTAAPLYGMVCVEHKNLPKAEIKKYREERKALARSGAAPDDINQPVEEPEKAEKAEPVAHANGATKKPAGRRTAVPVR